MKWDVIKEKKPIQNMGTSLGGTIRINVDIGLGEMISPLDSNYYQLQFINPASSSHF